MFGMLHILVTQFASNCLDNAPLSVLFKNWPTSITTQFNPVLCTVQKLPSYQIYLSFLND
jgi:hypothetical protein